MNNLVHRKRYGGLVLVIFLIGITLFTVFMTSPSSLIAQGVLVGSCTLLFYFLPKVWGAKTKIALLFGAFALVFSFLILFGIATIINIVLLLSVFLCFGILLR